MHCDQTLNTNYANEKKSTNKLSMYIFHPIGSTYNTQCEILNHSCLYKAIIEDIYNDYISQ